MIAAAVLSLLAWLYLSLLHGGFWRSGPSLGRMVGPGRPAVVAVVPARDEAAHVAETVGSLLMQDYLGPFRVVLVDDASADGTAEAARAEARRLGRADRLVIVDGSERPPGWAGKLWAVHQGVAASDEPFVLLTDADIAHDPGHVGTLVAQAERAGLDMVSEMVALHCVSWPERALIPAFVHFFQLLYPFAWVNDRRRRTAAAAGGTVLIRREALRRIGGIEAIRGALIDDVTLAAAVKPGGAIWLGHSTQARSIRPYPAVGDIWRMVTRSAYVQLRHSPALLVATTLGLGIVFLVPPSVTLIGTGVARWVALAAWLITAATFLPTLARFRLGPVWAPFLPAIAAFYMTATIWAAVRHHTGRGVVWKSRAYTETAA